MDPVGAGQGWLDIEAGGLAEGENEMETEGNDEHGMGDEKGAQWRRGAEAFADAEKKGVEGGGFGRSRPTSL